MGQKVNNLSEIIRETYEFAHGNDLDYKLFDTLNYSGNISNKSDKRSRNTFDTKNESNRNHSFK